MSIVVQNWYFARPEQKDEALETRKRASQVRAGAGRPLGRILVSGTQSDVMPAFIWECDYPDQAARDADLAWAEGSPEFTAVRSHMSTLLVRFERVTFEVT